MTGDEYVALLLERQATHIAEHPPAAPWMLPLLEWFIQPGDEDLFTPPPTEPAPKRATEPRTYRTAASLTEERDRLVAQCAFLGRAMSEDPATARVGAGLARRNAARMDRELQRAVALDQRISHLNHRIDLATVREQANRRPQQCDQEARP